MGPTSSQFGVFGDLSALRITKDLFVHYGGCVYRCKHARSRGRCVLEVS